MAMLRLLSVSKWNAMRLLMLQFRKNAIVMWILTLSP